MTAGDRHPLPSRVNAGLRRRQLGVEGNELGVQRAAERVHGGNDGERDAGGNQAVFDRCGACFIFPEINQYALHDVSFGWAVSDPQQHIVGNNLRLSESGR